MGKLVLTRLSQNSVQTLGVLDVVINNKVIKTFKSLELADKGNKRNVSCINPGTYPLSMSSNKIRVLNVPERSGILIHSGNYYTQIKGCILVGEQFVDINKDGYSDVSMSRDSISSLRFLMNEYNIDTLEIKKKNNVKFLFLLISFIGLVMKFLK